MKFAVIILAVLVSACQTAVPVRSKFPVAPQELLTGCETLQVLNANPKLSEVAMTVANNYSLYHKCSSKVESWQDWYQLQKSIYEDKR